jgi:acyl-CoA reductase-like NAD-dependent aldehyde dehydrogenase
MRTSEVFIGGQWRPPASGETYATINPATEEVSAHVAKGDELDTDLAEKAARHTFGQGPWPRMTEAERARAPWRLADLVGAKLG